MKNLVIILIASLSLYSCVNTKDEKRIESTKNAEIILDHVEMIKKELDGIEYHIYTSGDYRSGVFVINHTKELLEVEKLKKELGKIDTTKLSYNVTATMYNATKGQCDSDPLTTAGMYKINPKKATEQKYIAMSRDMISRWGGDFNYGDKVVIKGAGDKDGVYTVADTMNKRYKHRIDILETKGTPLYKYENVKIYKV